MKDVGNITRVNLDKRAEALMKFRSRLTENTKMIQQVGRGQNFNVPEPR